MTLTIQNPLSMMEPSLGKVGMEMALKSITGTGAIQTRSPIMITPIKTLLSIMG